MYIAHYKSSFGIWEIRYDTHIHSLQTVPSADILQLPTGIAAELTEALSAYFQGKLTAFSLPIAPKGTSFQLSVWHAVSTIPYGETRTYQAIADALHTSPRAVGQAVSKNPLWILIPCHRVIGKEGALTGYAGGLSLKEQLLQLENTIPM